jgi:hypothetical protein
LSNITSLRISPPLEGYSISGPGRGRLTVRLIPSVQSDLPSKEPPTPRPSLQATLLGPRRYLLGRPPRHPGISGADSGRPPYPESMSHIATCHLDPSHTHPARPGQTYPRRPAVRRGGCVKAPAPISLEDLAEASLGAGHFPFYLALQPCGGF